MTPNELVEKYQDIKLVTIRELHRLNYSARETSKLMGGANANSVNRIIKGDLPDVFYNIKPERLKEIDDIVKKLIEDYWKVKILTVKELNRAGFPLSVIYDKLEPNNHEYMNQLFKEFNANKIL